MFEVLLTQRAIKDLNGLTKKEKVRIINAIKYFSQDPIKHARKLVGSKIGMYRWRIGEYRVIFDLKDNKIINYKFVGATI